MIIGCANLLVRCVLRSRCWICGRGLGSIRSPTMLYRRVCKPDCEYWSGATLSIKRSGGSRSNH